MSLLDLARTTKQGSDNASTACPRPIPDESTWALLLEAYKKVKKDPDKEDIALFEAITTNGNGIKIPYEVRHIPGKGRGVICMEFVPKGTCMCDDRSGHFVMETQWREFLSLLPHDLAKDCVDWALVDDYKDGEAVFMDFSDVALLNHGSSNKALSRKQRLFSFFSRPKPRANLKGKYYGGMWHMDTTRDIQAGEELLCDYSQSHNYNHGLAWFEKICDEYYPETPHANELGRWSN